MTPAYVSFLLLIGEPGSFEVQKERYQDQLQCENAGWSLTRELVPSKAGGIRYFCMRSSLPPTVRHDGKPTFRTEEQR